MLPIRDDNPTRVIPWLTIALIVANVALFLYQVSLPAPVRQELVFRRGLVPALVTHLPQIGPSAVVPGLVSFVSSMFLHGDLVHLAGNMLFLWVFGNNVEESLGRTRFLVFYLACGLAAAFTQIAASPDSTVPMVGASGAIAGILGAYLLLFPRARVLTVIPVFIFPYFVRLPAFVVLGLWFLFQVLYSLFSDPGRGGVAWYAHVGGFVAGMILLQILLPGGGRRARGDRGRELPA
jgi:membrane associated rhomboid family serine protease